ncbi:Putative Holliday junction resolvase [Sedimentisphaera cyanobacteriorum]|uniref:Putative pre-16S rRNA nuclease n=1 Tax=Sedimentisphaera cyanobacteriorum TaxID=1940790 RepID=A0A1Q2HS43_9BACT|nr:Holliday junction resolvase RuvX [Sedimentisphaera cyanobacteriorum]AQQ10151.1 Putative Holliday junction resolvase [Sedimentisphaera cyanobacteriorum]
MIILAVDYGLKRTGLAVCDRDEIICSPLEVVELKGEGLAERIAQTAEEYNAEALVFGLPYNMDGSEGHQARKVRSFAEKAARLAELEVYFQDERLSSEFASDMLRPAELTRKKKKQRLDAVAAAAILKAFIEKRKLEKQ